MRNSTKYDKILDALQSLLEHKTLQNISVSEIAQTAGIGKGSIYYYFPSKDAILDALVKRKSAHASSAELMSISISSGSEWNSPAASETEYELVRTLIEKNK